MDARVHAPSLRPPSAPGRWTRLGRAGALLTIGIGIGVLATLPLAGGAAVPTIAAVLLASAAGALAFFRPGKATALGVVDVLLGLVVLATVFGRLGVLYIPSLLVFLAVTSRTESPDRSVEARPVEVPVAGSPLDDIEPEAVVERPVVVVDREAFEPATATPILLRRHARSSSIVEDEPARDSSRRPGRHRAPSEPRRLASWAVRAGRSVGGLARAGAGHVRSALAAGPVDDARRPVPDPQDGRSWDVEFQPPPQRGPAARRTIGDELRDELEARELEMVASAKSWSSFSHRAYGELRRLPLQAEPPPRSSQGAPEIDDEQWDGPTWQVLGDR